jgi:transcriptional regulator with XRE-family HTH domain
MDIKKICASRLATAMTEEGLSQTELCAKIGKSHAYLTPKMRGESTPTLEDAVRIGLEINRSPNHLSGWDTVQPDSDMLNPAMLHELALTFTTMIEQQAGRRPSVEKMTSIFRRGGGELSAFDEQRDYFDLFLAPSNSDRPTVIWAGPESLASIRIERQGMQDNAPELQSKIDAVKVPEFHQELAEAHQIAERAGTYFSLQKMDLPTPSGRVVADFIRMLYLVRDGERDLILNFAKLIG